MLKGICWLVFFSISTQWSQAQGNSANEDCTVTLWLKNPPVKEVVVDIRSISLAMRPEGRNQQKIVLDDNNKGTLKIPMKGPSIIKIMTAWRDSTASYVALPGVDLELHLDGLRKDTTQYDDIGPKETAFYGDIIAKSQERLAAISRNSPELFLKNWENEHKNMQELIASAPGVSRDYISWISQSTRSLFQSKLCRQLVSYVTITRRWPSNIKEYANKVDSFTVAQLNDPGFFTRETDRDLIEAYYLFYSLMQDHKKGLSAPNAEATYRNAIGYALKLKAAGSRDLMLRYLVTSAIAQTTDTGFLAWMKNTIVFSKQQEYLGKMIVEKQNLLQKLGKNKPAPYFEATDISGTKFSYQDYQGKYLLIDIWATWCVPCRKEIPYLEHLEEKYAGQPIAFISVSIDKNVDAWRKFVASMDTSDQFYSMPGKAFGIKEAYNADLIPVFVLIDQQGRIINPTSFRPSDPALELLLDELLSKRN
jgi:thiol-disulfide isomerase/thioredoxin